jgi:ABC-type transport system involved in multi-copper enzyme maturation permease subunit
LYKFRNIWEFFPWIAGQFNILLAILVIAMVTSEFRNKTFRFQLLNGLSREQLITGKGWMIFIISVYGLVLSVGASLVCGFFIGEEEFSWDIFQKAYMPLAYFVQLFAYLCMAAFFAFLLKRTAVSIIVFLLYLFPGEVLIRKLLFSNWEQYFPTKAMAGLTKFPREMSGKFEQAIKTLTNNTEQINLVVSELPLSFNIVLSLVYALVFLLLSYWILKKVSL